MAVNRVEVAKIMLTPSAWDCKGSRVHDLIPRQLQWLLGLPGCAPLISLKQAPQRSKCHASWEQVITRARFSATLQANQFVELRPRRKSAVEILKLEDVLGGPLEAPKQQTANMHAHISCRLPFPRHLAAPL